MNIYEKMQKAKVDLQKKDLKKTGVNKFSNYKYYELGDFMPAINEICLELKLFTQVNFDKENAILTIINTEKTDEKLEENDYYIDGQESTENEIDNKEDLPFKEDKKEIIETQVIDKLKKDLLDDAITKNNLSDELVYKVLDSYGDSSTSEIEIKNYMNIVNDFKKITGNK